MKGRMTEGPGSDSGTAVANARRPNRVPLDDFAP